MMPPIRTLALSAALLACLTPTTSGQEGRFSDLTLQPGDALRLELMDESSLEGEYDVAYDGMVLLPRLGFVKVAGRPFVEVEREIRTGFRRELGDPVLRVTPLVRVLVLGQVRQPGIFTVDPTHGMMDVLSYAGGLASSADRGKITLVRDGQVVARLDPDSNRLETRLHSGDRIVVGRVGWLRENVAVFIGALGSIAAAAVAGLIIR